MKKSEKNDQKLYFSLGQTVLLIFGWKTVLVQFEVYWLVSLPFNPQIHIHLSKQNVEKPGSHPVCCYFIPKAEDTFGSTFSGIYWFVVASIESNS